MTSEEKILYLSREEVLQACTYIDSIAIMYQLFKMHASGQTLLPDEAYLTWTNGKGENVRSLHMPGYIGGEVGMAGAKIINGNIANPKRGLPRASGLTVLFEDTTVRVACIMESAYISSLRTASVTAMAAELLSGSPIYSLAIIGSGALAQAHIEVLARRFPQLARILLFDIDSQKVKRLYEDIAPFLQDRKIAFLATASAEEAIKSAQLVVPVTTTTNGYIPFSWLQPGTVLVNVSLDDPLPEVVFKAHKVIVDDWNLVRG